MTNWLICWRASMYILVQRLRIAVLVGLLSLGFGEYGWISAAQASSRVDSLNLQFNNSELLLEAVLRFMLPQAVTEALQKGLPVLFVVEAKVLQSRWYWSDKVMAQASRYFRLSYLPLERKWRVQRGLGEFGPTGVRIASKYDTLEQAVHSMQSITGWAIAVVADLNNTQQYALRFVYKLDTDKLPRPLQIGLLGDSDWNLSIRKSLVFSLQQLSAQPRQARGLE